MTLSHVMINLRVNLSILSPRKQTVPKKTVICTIHFVDLCTKKLRPLKKTGFLKVDAVSVFSA